LNTLPRQVTPKKSLSQNFLTDQHIIAQIIDVLNPKPVDSILEVGPGLGALTNELVSKKATVLAIEIDKRLVPNLEKIKKNNANFSYLLGDFLHFDLTTILPQKKVKFISNIPYHLTGLFIQKLCNNHKLFESAIIMTQKEVALRLAATKGKSYGSLSVFTQFYADVELCFEVPRKAFFPVPKVDSAITKLTFKKPPFEKAEGFFNFVRKCFASKRKTLLNSLKQYFNSSSIREILTENNYLVTVRAEELSLQEFIDIYGLFLKRSLIQEK
jgi:16S rRNA (adenine1518-N6/adenine1519-N6)-dimethyltransferase